MSSCLCLHLLNADHYQQLEGTIATLCFQASILPHFRCVEKFRLVDFIAIFKEGKWRVKENAKLLRSTMM